MDTHPTKPGADSDGLHSANFQLLGAITQNKEQLLKLLHIDSDLGGGGGGH